MALLISILAALRVRDRTGEGQVVETALLRTAAWTIGCDVQTALVDRTQPGKRGRAEAFGPMNTQYQCADGVWLTLSALDQHRWPAFCEAIGRPELAADERYATPVDRFKNNREIIAELDAVFGSQPADHWAPRLDAIGIIWARVAQLPDLVDDPQARAIGMFVEVDHPTGAFETLAAPFTMSASDVAVRGRAPDVGEHTVEVLAELGVDDERVSDLLAAGVVGCPNGGDL
jgi:crotonobetainyl-CoA:carnitine CoA-transferase CaiB-like acyl-CoA transferase